MQSPAVNWRRLLLLLLQRNARKNPPSFDQIHALFLTTGVALHPLPFCHLLLSFFSGQISGDVSGDLSYFSTLLHHSPLPASTFLFPSRHVIPSLLKTCSSSTSLLPSGLAIHARILRAPHSPTDPFVLTSLLLLHSRRPLASRHLFDQISRPDLPAWNAILSCYARRSRAAHDHSSAGEALSLFRSLQLSSSLPNEITLVALLTACADLCALAQGVWAHAYLHRRNLPLNRFLAAALVDMYSRSGSLDLARQVFARLPQKEKDVSFYNAMLRGLAIHGEAPGALSLFDEIIKEKVIRPNSITFLLVMSACSHAGLADEGRRCFYLMETEFGIFPETEHFNCLVDLLCRAGRLDEAVGLAVNMPEKLNGMALRVLLGSCRIHCRLQGGDEALAMAKLVELEPNHGGNYVLLSNMLAGVGQWEGAVVMRKTMKERGICKTAGLSIVEIGGVVHEFAIADRAHPRTQEIYAMLHHIFN